MTFLELTISLLLLRRRHHYKNAAAESSSANLKQRLKIFPKICFLQVSQLFRSVRWPTLGTPTPSAHAPRSAQSRPASPSPSWLSWYVTNWSFWAKNTWLPLSNSWALPSPGMGRLSSKKKENFGLWCSFAKSQAGANVIRVHYLHFQ